MRRALLAIVVLFSLSVHAQKSDQGSPALERGLHADKLYQFNDFDNVSLFNGNLGIDVPIGPSYPVRGGLTYQLTLYYNSKFWDFDRSPTWSHAYPARSSNAGVGWTIGMGQYLGNETYQSPDGGEHPFNRPLEGYPKFTTDGTYLRLRNLSTDSQGIVEIDFPNGVVQHHERNADASWSLTEIRAPRGIGKVTMSVVAPGPCGTDQNFVHAWHIEDTEGRHTYVCFKTYTLDDVARPLASRVVFPAPPGQSPLQYDFTFETISDIPRVSGEYDPGDPEHEQWRMTHSVQFLKSLQSPDGSSWQFDHRLNEPRIETLVLPTKARIEYLYGLVPVTNEGQSGRCPGPYPEGVPPGGGMTDGVVKRTVIPVVAGGTLPPFVWTYDRILSGQQSHKPETCSDPLTMWDEMIVTVKDPLGGRVDSHFTMWQDSFTPSENGFKGEHYSLPWGKYDPDQDRYLSQEQYQCIGSDCTTKLTSTYVRHDIVPGSFTDTTLNRYPEHRLASQAVYDHQRVVHADSADNVVIDDDEHPCVSEGSGTRCPFTSTEWTEWDSFSHYRVVKSAYDFGGTEKGTRTVTTNWNAGRTINTGDPWVLDVFDEKTTEETGKDKIVEQACIQPGLGGFVRGTRLLAGPQSANDLITRLELDADMNPRAEKYYGGDATPLPQPAAQAPTACAALDALENVTPAFETANTWSKGVMTTSQYAGATFLGLDLDIDAAGIVTHSRDTAGAQTDYHYDAAGRIQSIEPPDGAEITYGYGNASAAFDGTVWRLTTPATAMQHADSPSGAVETRYEFDSLGRVVVEKKLMPGGVYLRQEHTYDALGRRTASTVWGTEPTLKSTKSLYDTLGRLLYTQGPDDAAFSYEYTGMHVKKRISTVWDGTADQQSETTETYDGFGRLAEVGEQSGSGSDLVKTKYGYDTAGHLTSVSVSGQPRTFHYDGRGLLTWETHPESGTTTYAYDARGHMTSKSVPAEPLFDLSFEYDFAERPRTVRDKQLRILKNFEYGTENGPDDDWRKGKLWKATRYNYPPPNTAGTLSTPQDTVVVTETYSYGRGSGRQTNRTTDIQSGSTVVASFTQSAHYDELDRPDLITYPACATCALPARQPVRTYYKNGRVDRVGDVIDAISYGSNGMWTSMTHHNGIIDIQTPDPDGLQRPREIRVSVPAPCLPITTQPADVSVATGGSATLTVATSATNATFQWFKGLRGDVSSPVPNGTSAELHLSSVTVTAFYWCRVTAGECTLNSEAAKVTVCSPMSITQPVEDAAPSTALKDRKLTFAVEATGSLLTYEWRLERNGRSPEPLGTGTTIEFTPTDTTATATDPIVIRVIVSNGCTSIDRVVARLIVTTATLVPCIISPQTLPLDLVQTIMPNQATTLSATMGLKPPAEEANYTPYTNLAFRFDWYQDGELAQSTVVNGSGDTVVNKRTAAADFLFRFTTQSAIRLDASVTCTTAGETLVSPVESFKTFAFQYGHCAVPDVVIHPSDTFVSATKTVVLNADSIYDTTDAVSRVTYTWYRGESGNTRIAPIGSGKTLTVTEAGTYWVRAFSDCGEHADSPTIVITGFTSQQQNCTPVRILHDPEDKEIDAGAAVMLSVDASGDPAPFHYSWSQYPNTSIPGAPATGATFTLTPGPIVTTDYSVLIQNDCSYARSRYARVHVTSCAGIPIVSQPPDASIAEGQSAPLQIVVGSTSGAVKYQWYSGDSGDTSHPVAGATNSVLNVVNPLATQRYWVRVSFVEQTASRCQVDSRTATVNVCRAPVITAAPANRNSAVPSQDQSFSVNATGEQLSYAWYEGALDDTSHGPLSITSGLLVYPQRTTDYWVKVTSDCASPYSDRSAQATFKVSVCPDFLGDETPVAAKTLVTAGTTTTLTVAVDRGDVIEWYRIVGNTAAEKFAEGPQLATVTTPPITQQTTFYAIARSGNCSKQSEPVTVQICTSPTVHWGSGIPAQVAKDASFTLTAGLAPGETASWKWYRGTTGGDVANSTLLSQSPGTLTIQGLQSTTSYWVRASNDTNSCYSDTTAYAVNVCIPTILTQPQSVSINPTQNATLTVTTDNLAGATYQWYRGQPGDTSNPLAGQTGTSVTVAPASTTTYWVRVFGCPSPLSPVTRDSAAATVSVCVPPAITTQPMVGTYPRSYSVTLTVAATGDGLHDQWYEGSAGTTTTPVGTDSSAFTFTTTVSKRYWVRVTGTCGTIDSIAVLQSVQPLITTQPAGGPITKGATRTLTVASSGTELSYAWYQRSGATTTLVNGATSASFTTPPVNADTTYFARVYSGLASTDSSDATLTVCVPNTFTATSYGDVSGSEVRLSIDVPVAGETYQWYRGASGDVSNPAGTGATKFVYPTETTQYWVRTTRPSCSADSAAKIVNVCRPAITSQPASGTIPSGSSTMLSVAANGTAPLYFQWYTGTPGDTSGAISGATASTYTTPVLTATTSYWARVTASSTCAGRTTDSAGATVTVCQPPVIVSQDTAKVVPWNYNLTLQVTATGDNIHYQWYDGQSGDTTKPVGTDGNQYTFTTSVTKYFWVRVSGTCGAPANSSSISVSVQPHITTQPANTTICGLGGAATFSVAATNVQSYQWYRQVTGQAQETVGTNSPTLSIAVPAVPVQFWAVLTSGQATATSTKASVSVNPVPTINSFTATVLNATQYQIKAIVKSTDVGLVKYRFYQGPLGDTSTLLADSTIYYTNVTPPSKPMTYWVRVYYIDTGCATDRAVTIQ